MVTSLACIVLLGGALRVAVAQTTEIPLTLADGERAWRAVTSGGGQVSWSGAGAAAEVTLSPGGGAVGIVARFEPAPAGLVDVGVSATTEGAAELAVQSTTGPDEGAASGTWTIPLSGGKRQRVAARLAPPAAGDLPLYLYVGARGTGKLRLAELALVGEALPPPVDTALKVPLPDGWQPEGTLDAQSREVAGTTELLVEVNGLEISIDPDAACTLGRFAPLSALVLARGTGDRSLALTGEFPEGVICDPREYPVTQRGTLRAPLRLQGVLPGAYAGKLTVSSGKESASLPVHLAVSRGYPAFGVTASDHPSTYRWQLREVPVRASEGSTAPELLSQVASVLDGSSVIPVILFDGLPSSDVLREFVGALKGKAGLYGAAWRPNRPYAGDAPQAEAEVLLAAAKELHSVVSTADPDAACISPVFDCAANAEGTAENRLLDACLALQMSRYFAAVVVTATPVPVGGVLGESVNDRNVREASAFWANLDAPVYPGGVKALMAKYDVSLPVFTSGLTGLASTDERLDAVKAARAAVIAAYAGATAVTFPEAAEPGRVALTRADGSLSPTGLAVKELSRELAGAAPIRRSWGGDEIPGRFGDTVVALPFVRDDECLLVLWNNSSTTRAITLTLGQVPYSEHVLTISRDDPFIDRTYQGHFEFSDRAVKAKRQEVYLRLAPLQVKVVRYRMELATPTWLQSLAFTVQPKGGPPNTEHDDRPWWQKLRDWAEGKE